MSSNDTSVCNEGTERGEGVGCSVGSDLEAAVANCRSDTNGVVGNNSIHFLW